ncbi:MAG: glycosyltransferase family 9 protein [Gammaproteobacteria bacterium]
MTKAAPESICIIRLSAIGDCCHTLPVVRTLQEAYPSTPITWIIGKTEHSLLAGADGIEFITFDKSRGLAGVLDVRKQLKGRHFPILLHMHASMRANLISASLSAQRRIGFDRARARDYQWLFSTEKLNATPEQHVMDGLFEFAEYLGVKDRVLRWDIPVSDEDHEFARNLASGAKKFIVISPCTSQRFRNYRNWSIENYQQLIAHLHKSYSAHVVLTGANTDIENEYADALVNHADGEISNLVGKTSLKRLLALLEVADLTICPDSGPAHMSAAVGTPVVGLYATSNRFRTGPYFSQHLVADRYPDAVAQEFDRPIKELRWGQRVRDPAAMELITLEDVIVKTAIALAPDYQHNQSACVA